MSVTFVSTEQGWVLGSAPCATGRCPAIAHTLDGGKTWTTINAPATKIADGPYVDSSFDAVSGLRFADSRDGWAFGPELWATHDGGATWKKQDVLSGAPVRALASARGTVHVEVYDMTGEQTFRFASAPVGGDQWTMGELRIPIGAGPVPALQLVLSGEAGWVLENDRTVVAGARLVSGTWRGWDPPCLDVVGPAYIAASSAENIVATCDVGSWSTPEGGHLYISHDGGATFQKIGPRLPFQIDQNVATPNTKTIVAGGSDTHETVLEASFDGGRTWAIVDRAGVVGLTDLGFTSPLQGVVIATAEGGASHLLMTRDGGHTWSITKF